MLLTLEQIEKFKKAIKDKLIEVEFFDSETSPSKFYGWGTGEQYVDAKQLVEGTECKVICTQILNARDNKPTIYEWESYYVGKQVFHTDIHVVTKTIERLNKADIVIGQNSKQFDVKVLQERAKILRLAPLSIDFMMDTLTASRASFKTLSHRLDYRSKQYGFGGKHKMELQDWIDIVEGKVSPQKKMIPYGAKDALDTREIFWKDLPYYNLPKATINKILKLIDEPEREEEPEKIEPLRFRCRPCALARQRRFDIDFTKKIPECKNCGSTKTEKV